jgi:hypothetical protein
MDAKEPVSALAIGNGIALPARLTYEFISWVNRLERGKIRLRLGLSPADRGVS